MAFMHKTQVLDYINSSESIYLEEFKLFSLFVTKNKF